MLRTLLVFGAAAAILLAVLWLFQRRLIYLPFGDVPPAASVLPGAEEVEYESEDGLVLRAWFLPAPGVSRGASIIVFNGNAGNRSHRAPLADALSRAGFSVLLTDYRGYGGNPGRPSEAGLVQDARAAAGYLASREDVDGDRIVYFGESLGAGVAVALAAEHLPAAMVLRSPFASLAEVGRVHYPYLPVGLLLRDRYASIDLISGIEAPLLVVAGEDDRIVPASQSRRLFEAARDPKRFLLIPGADHNDPELAHGEELVAEVTSFVLERGGG